jgi:hypothetical protein
VLNIIKEPLLKNLGLVFFEYNHELFLVGALQGLMAVLFLLLLLVIKVGGGVGRWPWQKLLAAIVQLLRGVLETPFLFFIDDLQLLKN